VKNMKVTVKYSAIPELLSIFKDEKEVQVDFTGDTVKDLLHNLFLKIGPKKGGIFVNDQGEISPWVSRVGLAKSFRKMTSLN